MQSNQPVTQTATRRAPRVEPLPELAFEHLGKSRPWVRLLGGFMLVCALIVFAGTSFIAANVKSDDADSLTVTFILFTIGCIYVTPAIYLLRYSSAIRAALAKPASDTMERALLMQLRYFRFVGIIVLVTLAAGVALIAVGAYNAVHHS